MADPHRPSFRARRPLFALAGLLLAVCLLEACATQSPPPAALPPAPAAQAPEPVDPAEAVVAAALDQLGRPYRYGGCDPATGFDCSGLVQYAYAQNGVELPRDTADLLRVGRAVGYAELAPADMVFFNVQESPKGLHVGLFVGGDEVLMVHSPKTGDTVRTVSIATSWWRKRFAGARRVLP